MRWCAFVLLLVACSDPDAHVLVSLPHRSRAGAAAPAETEPATTTGTTGTTGTTATRATTGTTGPATAGPATTPPPSPAPRAPISPEVAANVQRLVREARILERDGNHLEALARFDEALRLVPAQPRILCEAGFIAHRAGNEALAGRRIDAALAAFGEPRHVSDRLRVPLAMCLYNRGLVAEAESDPRRAVEAFEGSIALRPNATVDGALARARAAAAALPARAVVSAESGTVGGVPFASDAYVLATTDPARYEQALRAGLRGMNWDGTYLPASETTVVRQPIDTEGHPNVLVHTSASADGLTRLIVSWPLTAGYQAQDLELARLGESDADDEEARITELVGQWIGGVLRIDVTVVHHTATRLFYAGDADDERCEDGTDETVTRSFSVLCRNTDDAGVESFECAAFRTRIESAGLTSYSSCDGDEGEPTEEHTAATLARAVVTTDAGGVTISQVRDDEGLLNLEAGHYAWDEAFEAGYGDMILTEWVSDDD